MGFLDKIWGRNNKKPLLSEDEFTVSYFQYLENKISGILLTSYDYLELNISFKNDDTSFKVFLDNAFAEYKQSPQNIEAIFENYAHGLVATLNLQDEEIDLENVFPMIKNIDFIAHNQQLNPNFEEQSLYTKLNEELYLFYVFNAENTLKFLTQSDLETLNITQETLHGLALENLQSISEGVEIINRNGLYQVVLDGNFDASLVLLNLLNKENFKLKGQMIFAIPKRDVLLITGSQDQENLFKMKETAIDLFATGDHNISESLFVYNQDLIEIWG